MFFFFSVFLHQKEQEHSAEQSASVNKAYRTLQKPLSRGLYMVSMVFNYSFSSATHK